jgi:glucoamylase
VGAALVVALRAPATVHWGVDGWRDVADVETEPAGLGLHTAELPTAAFAAGRVVDLTWRDREAGLWAGTDHRVEFVA